jgi:hypothetical protein
MRHCRVMRGKLQCVNYHFAGSRGDVNILTPAMVHGGPQRVAMLALGCPSSPLRRLLMSYDFAPWWSKISFVVIHHAVIMCSAYNWECCMDLQSKLKIICACGKRRSHNCNGKSGSTEAKPEIIYCAGDSGVVQVDTPHHSQ